MSIDFEIPRYTIIREIGSGGMAVVYLATQEGLERPVAVKVLRRSLSGSSDEFKNRFMHEGRMLAQLEHENIVKIYDIGSTEDAVFMSMEYLKGGTLTQRMASNQFMVGDVIRVCAKIAMALHAAHRKNIIHRDLKPSNIMFRDPATPVLMDFGIARQIDTDLGLTKTGMMIGTPQYMSPEQVKGSDVDARSDIYSLGLMFYRLLTGELPFKATEPIALAMQQIQDPPPPLPEQVSELQPVMDLMLAKDRDDRYPSAIDFCNHLRSISLTGEGYATELSEETRVFDSSEFSAPSVRFSKESTKPSTKETSSVSRAISSIVSVAKENKKARNWGLMALIAVIAALIFTVQYDPSGITKEQEKRILHELKKFDAYMRNVAYFEPEDENATDSLRKMIAISPDYSKVRDAADGLAEVYEVEALEDYKKGELDKAADILNRGLEFTPDNTGLLKTQETVSAAIEQRERLMQIERLLSVANNALDQGNLLPPEPGNAYIAYKDVLALNGQNEAALAGLSKIQVRVVEQAKAAWIEGNMEGAKVILEKAEKVFGSSTDVSDLKKEIALEERRAAEQLELTDLLGRADAQFASGNLVEPASDNALASYKRVLVLRPDEQSAMRGLENIAGFYQEEARTLFEQGQFGLSLNSAAKGLQALSGHEGLLAVQADATAQLDAKSREIQIRIQHAQRLAESGHFIPGLPGMNENSENTMDVFKSVEEIDPGNPQASAGLASLPDRIYNSAENYRRENKLEQAKALLLAAQEIYPTDSRFISRVTAIDSLISERENQLRLQARLQSLDQLINQKPVDIELIDQIAQALRDASTEFPNEVSVSNRLSSFITMIEDDTNRSSQGGDFLGALAVIDHALILYPANYRLVQAQKNVVQSKRQYEEEEKRRIAALSGQLTIDATPWGRVMEIRNQGREIVDLPANAETPFVLTLPEGSYSVSIKGGDSNSLIEMTAKVRRQEVEKVRVELNQMTSQAYFEKSGW